MVSSLHAARRGLCGDLLGKTAFLSGRESYHKNHSKVSTSPGFPSQPQQQGWGSKLEVKQTFTLHCGVFKAPHRGKHFKWPQAVLIKYHCNLHSWYLVFLTCPWGWDFPLALPEVFSWGCLQFLQSFFPLSLYLTFSFILFHWWNQALISRVCVSPYPVDYSKGIYSPFWKTSQWYYLLLALLLNKYYRLLFTGSTNPTQSVFDKSDLLQTSGDCVCKSPASLFCSHCYHNSG